MDLTQTVGGRIILAVIVRIIDFSCNLELIIFFQDFVKPGIHNEKETNTFHIFSDFIFK